MPELSFLKIIASSKRQLFKECWVFIFPLRYCTNSFYILMQNNLKPRFRKWPSRVSSKHRKPLLFIFPFTHRKYTQATFYFCKCEIKTIAFHSTKFWAAKLYTEHNYCSCLYIYMLEVKKRNTKCVLQKSSPMLI